VILKNLQRKVFMKKLKNIINFVLFPHWIFAIIFAVSAAAMVVWQFIEKSPNAWVIYLTYFLVIYAILLIIARIPYALRMAKTFTEENKYVQKYLADVGTRVKIVIYYSIVLDLVFTLLELYLGIKENSTWWYLLGIFYGALVIIRGVLAIEARKNNLGENLIKEYKICLLAGILLCLTDVAIVSIMYYIVAEGQGLTYNYLITLSVAVYSFCVVTFTVMNLVRYRNHKSPIIVVAEWVNLAEVLMCVMFLETSIFAFIGNSESLGSRKIVTLITGVVICSLVFIASLVIIIASAKSIKQLQKFKKSE
jgi:hypothetical protein